MNKLFTWLGRRNLANVNPTHAYNRQVGVGISTKSVGGPIIALQGFGEAVWCEAGYHGLAKEGYLKNPVVYRCIRMISEAAASVPYLLYEGSEEMDIHPFLSLLAQPNSMQSSQDFLEAVYSNLLVSGDAYISRIRLDGEPRELHVLRSDRVTAISGEDGWPTAYDYSTGSGKQRFDVEGEDPLLHISLYNPISDGQGHSPLASAHMALDIHNAASRWNKALLDNSARPSGALVYGSADSTNMTEDQFSRLKSELEDGYTGASRAGRPMLLEGGLDWKPMGFSPKDMDFMEARNGASRDIALAFGIPPMLLGIPGDNTYANYQEANRVFWRQTALPMINRVSTALQNWLGPIWSPQLRLTIDRDQIEALAVDRDALWKRVNEASFLTFNEKRLATGYGALDNEGMINVQ